MPFQKGNTLARANKGRLGKRKKMFNEVSEQLIALSPVYNECLCRLMDGEQLPQPTKEGMDRFEKMFEFARPKLARQELVGNKENPLEIALSFTDQQIDAITRAADRVNSRSSEK